MAKFAAGPSPGNRCERRIAGIIAEPVARSAAREGARAAAREWVVEPGDALASKSKSAGSAGSIPAREEFAGTAACGPVSRAGTYDTAARQTIAAGSAIVPMSECWSQMSTCPEALGTRGHVIPMAAVHDSSCPRLSRASTSCFSDVARAWMGQRTLSSSDRIRISREARALLLPPRVTATPSAPRC